MRKAKIVAILGVLAIMAAGCGKSADTASTGASFEAVAEEATQSQTLATPVVKDGVMEPGEDAINVIFTWDPVDGADGYEVEEVNKYKTEEEYREPDGDNIFNTSEPTYTTSAQDEFDFRIRVRAYAGDGDNRQYSEWSEYAFGSAY